MLLFVVRLLSSIFVCFLCSVDQWMVCIMCHLVFTYTFIWFVIFLFFLLCLGNWKRHDIWLFSNPGISFCLWERSGLDFLLPCSLTAIFMRIIFYVCITINRPVHVRSQFMERLCFTVRKARHVTVTVFLSKDFLLTVVEKKSGLDFLVSCSVL